MLRKRTDLSIEKYPLLAASATVSVHGSGYGATYREVGGADATLLSSLANTCANIPGFLAPMFSLAMRRWSGWGLSFCWPTIALAVAAVIYCQTASLETARATIERSRRQPEASIQTSLSLHASNTATARAMAAPGIKAAGAATPGVEQSSSQENEQRVVAVTAMLHNGQSVTLAPFSKHDVGLDIKRALVAHPIAKELSALGPFVTVDDLHLVAGGRRLLDTTPLSALAVESTHEAKPCRVKIFALQDEMLDEEMRERLERMSTL
eukprot:COSAG02_NODE_5807_length_4023_cov_4.606014_3_plen_266_part_00